MAKPAGTRMNRASVETSGGIHKARRAGITRKPAPPPSNERGKDPDHRARFFTIRDRTGFTPYDSTWGW